MGSLVAGEATVIAPGGTARPDADEHTPNERAPVGASAGPRAVHRLRDLDRRDRWWGLALGAALLLAPVVALAGYLGDWTPTGDAALMGLRALDVGTSRTPLLGQPSSSGL